MAGQEHSIPPDARVILVCILLLACVLRLPALGESMWLDEVTSINFSTGTPDEIALRMEPQHLPVFFWYTSVLLWFGDSEVWLRLPSLLLGIGVVLMLFMIGRELGSLRTGLAAAGLASVSGILIYYSAEIRMYGLMTFLSVLATWAAIVLGRESVPGTRRRTWAVFFGASLLNLYTTPFALFMVAIHWGVVGVMVVWRRRSRTVFAVLGICLALAYIPAILHMMPLFEGSASALSRPGSYYDSLRILVERTFLHFGSLVWVLAVLLAIGSLFGAVLAVTRRNALVVAISALALVVPLLALHVTKPDHFFNPRYLLFAQPHLLVLMAVALVWLWDHFPGMIKPSRFPDGLGPVALSIAVTILGIAVTPLVPGSPAREIIGRKIDWRGMMEVLSSELRDNDKVLVEPSWDDNIVLYYLDRLSRSGEYVQLSEDSTYSWYRMYRHDRHKRQRPNDFGGPRITLQGIENLNGLSQHATGPGQLWLITNYASFGGGLSQLEVFYEVPQSFSYSEGTRRPWLYRWSK